MGILSRLRNLFDLDRRIYEAYLAGYQDGEDEPASGTTKLFGYRRAATSGLRDFGRMSPDQLLEVVWSLWQSNPLARRALIIKRDYLVGGGVRYQAEDEQLQDVLDAFWSTNELDRRLQEFALQLFLFGELCTPVFVRETDGLVRIGYLDPANIEDVIAHPDNCLDMVAVVTKTEQALRPWQAQHVRRVYRIVHQQEGVYGVSQHLTSMQVVLPDWELEMLRSYGLTEYSGDCFYVKVNAVSNQTRGRSDLVQVADWLDQHDETLFALADREQMAGFFSWDVTLVGANEEMIAKRAAQLRANPPKRGSVNVHNDAETWTFNYPDLKQASSIETANALLTFVLGGLGLPRHWYGYGDETNRATAQAQGDPTWRSLKHDQDIIKYWLLSLLEFVRDQAVLAGSWMASNADAMSIGVQMPEMTAKDVTQMTAALAQVVAAVTAAQGEGLMSRRTATEVLAKLLAELDIKVDVDAELQAADQDAEQMDNATGQQLNTWLQQHGDLTLTGAGNV